MDDILALLGKISPEHVLISTLLIALSVLVSLYIKLRKNNVDLKKGEGEVADAEQKRDHEEKDWEKESLKRTMAFIESKSLEALAQLDALQKKFYDLSIHHQECQVEQARQAAKIVEYQAEQANQANKITLLTRRVAELEKGGGA